MQITPQKVISHLKSLGCGIGIATRYVGAFVQLQAYVTIRKGWGRAQNGFLFVRLGLKI